MKRQFPMTNPSTPAYAAAGASVIFMEKMDDARQKLRKLKPFIGKRADGLLIRYNSGSLDEKHDLLEIINLLLHKHGIESIEEQVVLPPPGTKEAMGDISIGKIQYLNRPSYDLGIRFNELTRHTGIFGSTGTGKTTLAKNMLREMIHKNLPFIVFDWETNYRNIIKEYPQIKIFTIGSDVAPFFFNYLKIPPDLSYQDYIKNVIEVFNRAYIGGVGSDSILLKVFDEAYREHQMPTTEDARKILAGNMTGKKMRGREMLWKQSSLRMLEFLSYGGTGKVYNVKDFYPIEKLEKDFVIFELGALANSNDKRFFVEIFTLWYWLYKEHQGIEDEALKHVMVFEEFHNIVDNSQKDDLIQKIFRQIRKYGTGLVIIDQTPSLIPIPIFENLYTKVTFSLNHKRNVDAVANAMNMDHEERKFIGMLKTGQAICRLMSRYIHPFLIQVPFIESALIFCDNEVRGHMEGFYKDYNPNNPQICKPGALRIPT
ncbi:ATP-binding protein, partial [Thermodesulfobacteriota bacterium]